MANQFQEWKRRDVLRGGLAAAVGLAAGPWVHVARAQNPRKLRILQWRHFVPGYDAWFNDTFAREWGEQNDVQVTIDNVVMQDVMPKARRDIAAQGGHDMAMFLSPPCTLEPHAIDHNDLYQDLVKHYGQGLVMGDRCSYNPTTRKRYCIVDSYAPDPVNYRKDLWDEVGILPASWEAIYQGGVKIKRAYKLPVGLGLAPELDSNVWLRTLMAGYGAYEQTADGYPAIKSKETGEALKFVKGLYKDAMSEEVFSWNPASNNLMMLGGRCSLVLNAISITRSGEENKIPVADKTHLVSVVRGPVQQVGLPHLMSHYVIWKFSKSTDLAQKFLFDYIGRFREAFLSSQFFNFPCFPGTVKDLPQLLASDPSASPPNKYAALANAAKWSINLGYPGYANAAIDDVFNQSLISNMFAQVASGAATPEEAMNITQKKAEAIFEHWRRQKII